MTRVIWDPTYAYTRAQAVLDGKQVWVNPRISTDAGLSYPIFITRAAFDEHIKAKCAGQSEADRVWDVLWTLHFVINAARGGSYLDVPVYLRDGHDKPKLVVLKATCGPLDYDDGQPAITIMLLTEDDNRPPLEDQ